MIKGTCYFIITIDLERELATKSFVIPLSIIHHYIEILSIFMIVFTIFTFGREAYPVGVPCHICAGKYVTGITRPDIIGLKGGT